MRLRRIAFWSAFGLLVLIVSTISWLLLADLGSFKPQIEQWASERTGRQISIEGELHINLARHSSVVAEGVHVSNAAWAEDTEMISIGRLEVRLDLRSIWNGPVVVELIDLDDAKILLSKPADGDPNWMLPKPDEVVADEDDEGREKKGFLFKQIDIDRVELSYTAAKRDQSIRLMIENLSQTHRDDDFLDLSFNGMINGRAAQLDGQVGTWAALLERKNVQIDFDARLDSFELAADGHIDDLLRPHRPTFDFVATGPDINELLRLFGAPEEGQGIIELAGSMVAETDGPLVLDVQGQLGRVEIEASGSFSDLQDLEEIDIDLLASGDDVRPILSAIGIQQTRESPFMVNIDAQRSGKALLINKADMLFGEARFGLTARVPSFPHVDDAIIGLQINGPDIVRFREVFNLPGKATGAFSIGFTIDVEDDGIELLNLDLETSLGHLRANGSLGPAPQYFGTTLSFELSSDDIAHVGEAYGVRGLPDQPVAIMGRAEFTPDGIQTLDAVTATIGGANLEVDGLIRTVKGILGSDFEFRLIGPSLADLMAAFAPIDTVPEQAYDLQGQLQVRDDGYRFRSVAGTVGTSAVSVDGLLVPKSGIVGSHFDLAASGPAFEELIDAIGDLEVIPGPFEFGGNIFFRSDMIDFEGVELHRDGGDVSVNLELGMPVSRHWLNFDMQASGPDVRSILRGLDRFEANEAPFAIDVRGEWRGRDWDFSRLDVSIGGATLNASGVLDFTGDDASTQFDLNLDIPSTAILGSMDGYRMREQSFKLDARVTGSAGVLEINDMIATLGESDINGDVRYVAGDVPEVFIDIESDAIIFTALLEDREEEYDSAPEFDDGRLIPDIAIPFDMMKKLNASIEVDIGELQRDNLHIRDVTLRSSLRDGALRVSDAGFKAKSGAITARASIEPGEVDGRASVEIVARELALGMTDLNQDLAMTGDFDISLQSTGSDTRTLAGNLNGVFFANTRGGRIANSSFLRALYGDALDEILSTINPFSKSAPYTNFNCVILPLQIVDGVITSHPNSLVSTGKMQMVLKSEVKLKTEVLNMNVRTTPRTGISISAGEIVNPYVKLVGTLASPRLAVDEKGVLLSGGVAVATGGLSVLARAAWTRMSRSKDPCGETASEGIELLGDQFPNLELVITEPELAAESSQPES